MVMDLPEKQEGVWEAQEQFVTKAVHSVLVYLDTATETMLLLGGYE